MIQGFSDHAANERTFLAWVRTGIAVIAFGFVIERFDLFVLALISGNSLDPVHRSQLARLLGPFSRYEGLVLILFGIALIILATARFVRIGRRLDDAAVHSVVNIRAELFVSAALALLVGGFSAYLVLS